MKLILIFLLLLCPLSNQIFAYDEEDTHPEITQIAARKSKLEGYLAKNLAMPLALATKLPFTAKENVLDLVKKGSTDEDIPFCRASNHFQNPLKAWNESYMNDEPWYINKWCGNIGDYKTKYSNVTWATGYEIPDGEPIHRISQRMGWDDARNYFHKALIASPKTEREEYFAKTFQALGQVIHLLQDMGVPAHVRNDFRSHMNLIEVKGENPIKWFGNLFEEHVKRRAGLVSSVGAKLPELEKPKVTDLWDTLKLRGGNTNVDLTFGLAEYTHVKYLSENTIRNNNPQAGHSFVFPKLDGENYRICVDYDYNSLDKRKYISRSQKGACPPLVEARAADHFVAVSLLDEKNAISNERIPSLKLELDQNVHETYARELIPLAIGYSAALLDHFFRGDIEISLPEDGFYSLMRDGEQGFTGVSLMAKNLTAQDEEMPDGSIHLVVHYKMAMEDPFQSQAVPTSDFKYIVVPEKNNVRSIPRNETVQLEFDLSSTPIPLYATDAYLQVVYRGKLGLEKDAVVVGFRDIGEPTPMDIFNMMDKVCINGVWYDAGSGEAIEKVDWNGDGYADWDVFAHNLVNYYILFSRKGDDGTGEGPPDASEINHHLHIPLLEAGENKRVSYILSDYEFNLSYDAAPVNVDDRDRWPKIPHMWCTSLGHLSPCGYERVAVRNQDEYVQVEEECGKVGLKAPCWIRYYSVYNEFRGLTNWQGLRAVNGGYPPGVTCSEEGM